MSEVTTGMTRPVDGSLMGSLRTEGTLGAEGRAGGADGTYC